MGTMLEAIEDTITQEPGGAAPAAEVQPGATHSDDRAMENQLAQEISELWSNHVRLSGDRKATAKELRLIRARLAERLHEMKSLLSRPGCLGQWRG